MEGQKHFEYLKSKESRNEGYRNMLYKVIGGEEGKIARVSENNGLFSYEMCVVDEITAPTYSVINQELGHIKSWDTIIKMHVKPNTSVTNPLGKSTKELMADGMKWIRDEVIDMPIDKRPKYLVSYSHITDRLGKKHRFTTYDVPQEIKEAGASRNYFGDEQRESRKNEIIRLENQIKEETNLEKIKERQGWIDADIACLGLAEKYSPDDIKLIVEPIEHLLALPDSYFENLKKPSEESSQ